MKQYKTDIEAYNEGKRRWMFRNPLRCEPIVMEHYAWHFAHHRTLTRHANDMRIYYWKKLSKKQQEKFNTSLR